MKKKKLQPLFQDKVSLHRAFLSKNGKNLNKSFLAFYNSLKSESKKEQGIKAIRNKQESISGFITKSGNFGIQFNQKQKGNDDKSNASYWINRTKEVEKNVEQFHLESIKQYAEEKRNEIISENRKVRSKHYLKVNYNGIRKHTPLIFFGKSKRSLDWLEPKDKEDSRDYEDKMSISLRYIPVHQQRRQKDKMEKRHRRRFCRSMNLNLIKMDRPTQILKKSSILDMAFESDDCSLTFDRERGNDNSRGRRREKQERLTFVRIRRYKQSLSVKRKLKSLSKEVNKYRRKRVKRMFRRLERKYAEENSEEEQQEASQSNLLEQFKIAQEQKLSKEDTEKSSSPPQIPKKKFSHLFFQKMKRRRQRNYI